MIEGIIFDMDGTLIDSEPLWQEAEIELFQQEGLKLSAEDCILTQGLQISEAINYWHKKIKNPSHTAERIAADLVDRVSILIRERGILKEGTLEILDFLKTKNIPLAIASSAPLKLIKQVVEEFRLNNTFQLVYSGDSEALGKPHPGIFLSVAAKLKTDPVHCIAFEDSFHGMIAAKAARMKLVVLLNEINFKDTKYDFADLKLQSFYNFGHSEYNYLESLMN